ncbi:MAG: hypothetical protein ACK559_02425, partial [bacterium]
PALGVADLPGRQGPEQRGRCGPGGAEDARRQRIGDPPQPGPGREAAEGQRRQLGEGPRRHRARPHPQARIQDRRAPAQRPQGARLRVAGEAGLQRPVPADAALQQALEDPGVA